MLTLIDLSHAFWRNYFGTGSAVTAYEQTLDSCKWYHDNSPRTVVCCEGRGSLRKSVYPEYKANREAKPEEALDSLTAIGQQMASWGVPIVAVEGYEADDIIATLTKQAWIDEVQIWSNDKDLYQLLSPTVRLVGQKHIGPAECVAKFGVHPHQMRDWLAMVGDPVDNVPGCPNCGPGRARDLLQRFGSLELIRAASDDEIREVRGVGPKTLASLREWNPDLALSLVTLMDDAPVKLDDLWKEKGDHEQ